jgi:hypothetical protein
MAAVCQILPSPEMMTQILEGLFETASSVFALTKALMKWLPGSWRRTSRLRAIGGKQRLSHAYQDILRIEIGCEQIHVDNLSAG